MGGLFSVKTLDRGWNRIVGTAKALAASDACVKAGVTGSKAQEERDAATVAAGGSAWQPMTNVKLALIHEFGTKDGRIPARSFVRSSFDKHRPAYEALLQKLLAGAVFEGRISYEKALALIGQKMASDMRDGVRAGIPPPNAPSTLAAKLAKSSGSQGAPKPLIDTGRLLGSITYGVARAGESDDGSVTVGGG